MIRRMSAAGRHASENSQPGNDDDNVFDPERRGSGLDTRVTREQDSDNNLHQTALGSSGKSGPQGEGAGRDGDLDGDGEQRNYDFVELYAFDVDCVPRGRLVDGERFEEINQFGGLSVHAAICYYTNTGTPLPHPYFSTKWDGGECLLKPDTSTTTTVQKSVAGDFKVAQVICDPIIPDHPNRPSNTMDMTSPRAVAQHQLDKLKGKGFTIQCGFEMRCVLTNRSNEGGKFPEDNDSNCWGDMVKLSKHEAMMLEFMGCLQEMGLSCATAHPTAGSSHYEFGLAFDENVKGADKAARFRKEAILFFEKKGFPASFRCHRHEKKNRKPSTLPMHMNHFLQDIFGQNVFNDGPYGISDVASHWLAGICLHLPALMAIFRPTESCYVHSCRRLARDQRPPLYGIHSRNSHFRRKENKKGTFLENRLPCSASNPYLVMAGTIAAGLHGIQDEIQLITSHSPEMPNSLPEALEKLERDEYLNSQLGEDFVGVYIEKKKTDLISKYPSRPYKKSSLYSLVTSGLLSMVEFLLDLDYIWHILRNLRTTIFNYFH